MARPTLKYQAILRSSIQSKKLGGVSRLAGGLFYGLLLVSDQKGRFYGEATLISGHVFPRKIGQPDTSPDAIESELQELEAAGLIERYVVDGDLFLSVNNYFSLSNKGRDKSIHPSPDEGVPWVADCKTSNQAPETHVPEQRGPNGDQVGTRRGPSGDPIPYTLNPKPETLNQRSAEAEHDKDPQESSQSLSKPKRKRKPPVNGKEELANAMAKLGDHLGHSVPVDLVEACEEYRQTRVENRWPVWKVKNWGLALKGAEFDGEFDAEVMRVALMAAVEAPYRKPYPKKPTQTKPSSRENLMRGIQLGMDPNYGTFQ